MESATAAPPKSDGLERAGQPPETDEQVLERMREHPNDTDFTRWPKTGRPETEPAVETNGATPPTPPAALPDDGEDEEEEKDPLLFLLGHKQLGVKVGGFKPDTCILKIKGGKIDVDGQFDLGDRFPAVFTLQVTGNGDRHSIELETGTIKSQNRAQEATVCGTATLATYLQRKLEDDHPELLAQVLSALGTED
jgi:hypothetical protein